MNENSLTDVEMLAMATTFLVFVDPRRRAWIKVDARNLADGGCTWAVVNEANFVLNRDFQWEYEPMPAARDDDFIARARWDDARSAIMAARQAIPTE